jgi:hypothetical protein
MKLKKIALKNDKTKPKESRVNLLKLGQILKLVTLT